MADDGGVYNRTGIKFGYRSLKSFQQDVVNSVLFDKRGVSFHVKLSQENSCAFNVLRVLQVIQALFWKYHH